MSSKLFSPLDLGPFSVPNRIAIAPMCQYSADDGSATDWHLAQFMSYAMSGAGLVVVEATGVERRGRITQNCLGLYSDSNERALKRCLDAARAVALPGTRFGIQLAHAGRKASTHVPWAAKRGSLAPEDDAWQTVAPSALAFDEGWAVPAALDDSGIKRTIAAFVQATERAARIGFDLIELHMAHGYLMHEFQSPLSNHRTDRWGGDAAKRASFLHEVAAAVKAAMPPHMVLAARITGTDWVNEGLGIDDAVNLAATLKEIGVGYICVSSGGNAARASIPLGPGYQVPLAAEVRRRTGVTTRAVGLIVAPQQAEDILQQGQADTIAIARAVIDDPHWGWHAARDLGDELALPKQLERGGPGLWPGAKIKAEWQAAPRREAAE